METLVVAIFALMFITLGLFFIYLAVPSKKHS
ncbi:hypothetical protein CLV27_1081 [Phorcysia thermohydrogeniphila]|jgi:hypothetical protein|uniref:Uncharacterized protein n=1 Tax=Phorcysia thermohydrogeniphila TaxID=936138 RepID=A0A4R1GAB0_9BACT|nr:hypothetical protein CLV27_1081 [Phorcysia thermohydrogeniphila]